MDTLSLVSVTEDKQVDDRTMSTGREKTLPKDKGIERKHDKEVYTDRSGWWRNTIKNTPIPDSYHIRDFIEETGLNPVPRTYGFKGTGRNTLMPCVRRGDMLLPGAYNFTDSTKDALQRQATYSFKNCPRPDNYTLGIRDKDINLSPGHYDVMKKPVPKSPCKHVMFRSAVRRVSFLPKEGPAPGSYNPRPSTGTAVTSCFRSTVPQLYSVHSGTPGPGAYEPTWHKGQRLSAEVKVDWAHDLLFRNIP
ncbi:protein STPG4 [Xyrauchen texanus]|uniref:protein STPG4 n=1 Tax=Xyrauchen texanus TaxID=154827 RepID=UPI0022421851|nr:protein STPG4 [Xyrauchen texanus]